MAVARIEKLETFDPDNLKHLLIHDGIDKETKLKLKQYKKASFNGNQVLVKYHYPTKYRDNEIGRIYADKGLGLQMFQRDIRSCLAQKYYIDVDIRNAHTNIIRKVARDNGWDCAAITYYSENTESFREDIAKAFDVDFATAKQLILVVMYGGKIDCSRNQKLKALQREMASIADNIYNKYPKIKESAKKKTHALDDFHKELEATTRKMQTTYDKNRASALALYIQTEELTCLFAIDSAFLRNDRQVDVLIHDGCFVKKLDELEYHIAPDVLAIIQSQVLAETGYDLTLVCKDMKSQFLFNNNVPTVDFISDDVAAGHLYRLIEGKIVKSGDDYWVFDDTLGIWTPEYDVLKSLIHRNSKSLIFNVCDDNNRFGIHDYGGMVYNIERMTKLLSNHCPRNRYFIEKNIDSSMEKLVFSDGIYDFKTDTFTPGFDPKIVSLYNINKPFIHDHNQDAIDHIDKLLFKDPFLDEDADVVHELKKHASASIAGKYRSKKFRTVVGSLGDSGKGTFCDALSATFEQYVKAFNGANLFDKTSINTDDEKKGLWKLDLNYKRMGFSNEISMTGHLDGNAIKSIASGGDEYDARRNHKDPISARFRCQLWMMLNDVPKIKPYDAALDRRMACFEYKMTFKPNPDLNDPLQKRQDESIKELFQDAKYQYALFDILRASYQDYLREGFVDLEKLQEYKREWLQSDNALLYNLSKAYELTYDENDSVPSSEIEEFVIKECKMQISPRKLALELTSHGFKSKLKKINNKPITSRFGIKSLNSSDILD